MRIILLDWWRVLLLALAVAAGAWWLGAQHLSWSELMSGLGIIIFGVWTTPKTWTAAVVTVAELNTHIRDNLNILKTSIDDAGHLIWPVFQSKSTTYSIAATDDIVKCTSGTFTVTLPTAVGRTGKPFVVKNLGTGVITMASTSSQTIDGAAASAVVIYQFDSYTFLSDGSNWVIV